VERRHPFPGATQAHLILLSSHQHLRKVKSPSNLVGLVVEHLESLTHFKLCNFACAICSASVFGFSFTTCS
jgi:hypothetical protein